MKSVANLSGENCNILTTTKLCLRRHTLTVTCDYKGWKLSVSYCYKLTPSPQILEGALITVTSSPNVGGRVSPSLRDHRPWMSHIRTATVLTPSPSSLTFNGETSQCVKLLVDNSIFCLRVWHLVTLTFDLLTSKSVIDGGKLVYKTLTSCDCPFLNKRRWTYRCRTALNIFRYWAM